MNVPISTTIERMEMMMPKMNFTIPNMTSPTMQRAIYPNQATKVMRVEPTAESNLHQVCVILMFVVICLELNLFAVPGAEGKFSFLHLFVAPFSDIFFWRLPVASVVSFQVPFKGGEAGNTRFFGKILPNGVEIFSKTEGSTFYFQSPLPYLCTCTITVDAKRKDPVEERKSERQMKIETSRKFLDCTIIAYPFLRNGYNYCLANVFRKMEIAYKNGTAFREIPVKEEYGLSMLLASGFLQGCAAKHESGR